jgi:protein TonB
MSSDEQTPGSVDPKDDNYTTTVLDFLDGEISALSGEGDGQSAQQDDVNMLVENLLKETITSSDEKETTQETGTEDLDLLVTSILHDHDEVTRPEPKGLAIPVHPRFNRAPEEISRQGKGIGNIGPAGKNLPHEAASSSHVVVSFSLPTVSTEPVPSPAPPAQETQADQPALNPAVAASSAGATSGSTLVFAPPVRKLAWSKQKSIVMGALICLLAGVGIVYFTGSKKSPSSQTAKTLSPITQMMPAKAETVPLPQNTPNPDKKSGVSSPRAAQLTPVQNAPAVLNNSGNRNPAPAKAGKAAASEPLATQTNPIPSTVAVAPGEKSEGKTSAPVPPHESTLANQVPRPAENTLQLPIVQTPAPAPATLAQLVPNAASNLEGLTPASMPAVPIPPTPKSATPPVVVSRVLPAYPDMARRSRITGTVVVDVEIDDQGRVVKATPESGPLLLRADAVSAVLKWRFKPATLNGANISSTSKVSIIFTNPQ